MGDGAVDWSDGGFIHVEVYSVPEQIRFPGDGLLPHDRERRRGDAEAKHGSHSTSGLSEHHHLVAVDSGLPCSAV